MSKRLTETTVERLSVKPKPYVIWDANATGLGIKITPAGRRIWCLQLRYPRHKVQTTRTLGTFPGMGVAQARAKAEAWYGLVRKGIDPEEAEAEEEAKREAARRAEELKKANSFASVAERYISEHLAGQRRAGPSAREIRGELVKAWGSRPIASISPADVKATIAAIKTRAPYQARNCFGHARTLFRWAVHNDLLEVSPVASLAQQWVLDGVQIGPRQRSLNDSEIVAFWRTAKRLPYAAGPFYQLLILLGCRFNELGHARWSELDPEIRRVIREARKVGRPVDWAAVDSAVKTLTIPRERFKSDAEHIVPLSDAALAILETLPHFAGCDFLFSVNGGVPARLGSKDKTRLDAGMVRTLRALARRNGDDPKSVTLAPFVIHDLRRVVRSNLAALEIPDHVAEMCLGHGRKGIQRVYDQHKYATQIREALERWAAKLREIVDPAPSAPPVASVVVPLRGKRG